MDEEWTRTLIVSMDADTTNKELGQTPHYGFSTYVTSEYTATHTQYTAGEEVLSWEPRRNCISLQLQASYSDKLLVSPALWGPKGCINAPHAIPVSAIASATTHLWGIHDECWLHLSCQRPVGAHGACALMLIRTSA